MASIMAASGNDITRIQGGQLSSLILLGETSKKLKPDEEGEFGVFTSLVDEQMKWMKLAAQVKKEGGPMLQQFGNDLQSLEMLAAILRTEADTEVKRKLFMDNEGFKTIVGEEAKRYSMFKDESWRGGS